MGQKQSEICPIYMNSLQVTQEIERRFIVSPHPIYTTREEFKLLHEKLTNKKFMLRVITADQSQKKMIQPKILKRVAFKNTSLTKLEHYIFQKIESYCAKQFKIYLLFQLEPSSTLREQILLQVKGQPFFTEEQIIAGFQNLINGLLWIRYIKERHGNINTHHIYCSNHKMILSDPFLCPQSHEFPEKYPSPQKLKEMNNRIEQYDHYQADIFSIAMCMLEIIPGVKLDAIYKRNYTLNEKNLREQINKCSKYPKLKIILESLLIDADNLENRKKYLQIYSNKCNFLFKSMASSSVSDKTVKIHTLGGSNKHENRQKVNILEQNKKDRFSRFNKMANISTEINVTDKPQIDTRMLLQDQSYKGQLPQFRHKQYKKDYNLSNIHNNSIFTHQLTTNNSNSVPDFSKKVVFNYNNHSQNFVNPLSQLKTINSRALLHSPQQSNFRIPHHLYQFNTAPQNPRNIAETRSLNALISRSNSDFSVKSQLVVYQPNKSGLNVTELISPRKQSIDISTRQPEYVNTYSNYKIQTNNYHYRIDPMDNRENFRTNYYTFNQQNVLNSINQYGEFATSIGISQNEKPEKSAIKQQNYNVDSSLIQKLNISEVQSNNIQSLPLKLSFLVKSNIPESSLQDEKSFEAEVPIYQEKQHVLKTPERQLYLPVELNNRTIPEEQHEQEQSFEGAQKLKRGSYKIEQYQNGGRYQGFFLNNMRHGYGTLYYKEGGYYQGQWKQNLMNGMGKLFYDNQRLAYDGQWYNDEFHGKGKVYNDSWQQLQGKINYESFESDQPYWVKYDGELSHDCKEGFGKWIFSNGQYYEGEFKGDFPHGKGVFYSKNDAIKGIWANGKFLKKL